MPFGEFRRRFDILAASQFRNSGPVLDEKKVSGIDFLFLRSGPLSVLNYNFLECANV